MDVRPANSIFIFILKISYNFFLLTFPSQKTVGIWQHNTCTDDKVHTMNSPRRAGPNWGLLSSGMLRSVIWQLATETSVTINTARFNVSRHHQHCGRNLKPCRSYFTHVSYLVTLSVHAMKIMEGEDKFVLIYFQIKYVKR